jgi:hypothetical protein
MATSRNGAGGSRPRKRVDGITIAFGLVALGLLVLFLGPTLVKLKDFALGAVILVGLVLAAVDTWQDLRSPED